MLKPWDIHWQNQTPFSKEPGNSFQCWAMLKNQIRTYRRCRILRASLDCRKLPPSSHIGRRQIIRFMAKPLPCRLLWWALSHLGGGFSLPVGLSQGRAQRIRNRARRLWQRAEGRRWLSCLAFGLDGIILGSCLAGDLQPHLRNSMWKLTSPKVCKAGVNLTSPNVCKASANLASPARWRECVPRSLLLSEVVLGRAHYWLPPWFLQKEVLMASAWSLVQ